MNYIIQLQDIVTSWYPCLAGFPFPPLFFLKKEGYKTDQNTVVLQYTLRDELENEADLVEAGNYCSSAVNVIQGT